jgi:glycine cleavage system H lipoate-binding protein
VNQAVVEDYSRLVADPYDEGWLMALTPTNLEGDIKNLVPGTGA